MNKILDPSTEQNSLDIINIRNNFYYHNYRNIILAMFLGIITLSLTIFFYYYQKRSTSGTVYFATSPEGILIDLPPLNINHLKIKNLLTDNKGFLIDQPKININDLGNDLDNGLVIYWVKQVITTMFDFDYINYRRTLQDLRNYFAPGAHGAFIKAFDESKNLETILQTKRVVRAEISDEPIVKKVGILKGKYVWNIHAPIKIYYENVNDQPLIQQGVAKLWILRVSTLQSPFFGLSIVTLNLEVT